MRGFILRAHGFDLRHFVNNSHMPPMSPAGQARGVPVRRLPLAVGTALVGKALGCCHKGSGNGVMGLL